MIITKTPFRMSFFGGGTDLPQVFNNKAGAVISTSFDKYVYITVRHLPRFFEYTTELTYSVLERVTRIDDLKHPLVRNAMKYLDMHELHIAYDADLPARSGLGSSSSFAVGLLNAFYNLKSNPKDKRKLADDAIYVERILCNECGGWQDQIAVSFGGLNRIDFNNNDYIVTPIKINPNRKKRLNDNLMLFFTGFTRLSSDIQKNTSKSLDEKKNIFDKMLILVDEAQNVLENDNIELDKFGMLLGQEWELKKNIGNSVSSSKIDEIYQRAINAGAIGGKLLGAGGGGFMLFYVSKENQDKVRKAVDLLEVPFNFEDEGTSVIYCAPETFDKKLKIED